MKQRAFDAVTKAMDECKLEKDVATRVKQEFDALDEGTSTWHCIIGTLCALAGHIDILFQLVSLSHWDILYSTHRQTLCRLNNTCDKIFNILYLPCTYNLVIQVWGLMSPWRGWFLLTQHTNPLLNEWSYLILHRSCECCIKSTPHLHIQTKYV